MTTSSTATDRPAAPERVAAPGCDARVLACLLLLGAFAFGWGFSSRPLYNPDESRYAEMAREMWETGDWVVPRLEGVPYLDKPPLQLWLTAPLIGLLGPGEAAPRLVPLLAALATLAALYAAGRRAFGPAAGAAAGVIWATAILPIALAHVVNLDMLLTALVTGSVLCFWKALGAGPMSDVPCPKFNAVSAGGTLDPGPRTADAVAGGGGFALLGWALAGLAFLTKGPIGFVIPAMAGAAYAAAHRRFPWRRLALPWGVPLCLAIVLPWCVAIHLRMPTFLERFFLHENFSGFLHGEVHHKGQWYQPLGGAVGGLFPWSLLLLPAAVRARAAWGERGVRFLGLWALLIVAFFTLSASKLVPYVAPALPPLALIGGALWVRSDGRRVDALPFLALAGLGAVGCVQFAGDPRLSVRDATISLSPGAAVAAGLVGGGMLVGAIFALRRRPVRAAGVAAVTMAAALAPTLDAVRSHGDTERSARGLVERQAALLARSDVVQIGKADYSISYYLRRPILFAINMPNELDYGLSIEPSERVLREQSTLRDFLARRPRVAVFAYADEEPRVRAMDLPLTEADRWGQYILYVNRL